MTVISTPHTPQGNGQGGFSLAEVAIALAIIGVLMAGTLMLVDSMRESRLTYDTQRKMSVIADALSIYAQTHNRLPCPADPVHQDVTDGTTTQAMTFGDERKLTGAAAADINRAGNCFDNNTNSHGIVPYRALGLPEQYARDSWGRYFTYVVSPVFARYNYLNVTDTTANRSAVHHAATAAQQSLVPKIRFCHTMQSVPQPTGLGAPINTATDANDIETRDNLINAQERFPFARSSAQHVLLSPTLPDRLYAYDHLAGDNDHTRAIAFSLLSHGPNGSGSYIAGNNTAARQGFAEARVAEQRNAQVGVNDTNPNQIFALEIQEGGVVADRFDDIVLTMTQDQIYARKGAQSCVIP